MVKWINFVVDNDVLVEAFLRQTLSTSDELNYLRMALELRDAYHRSTFPVVAASQSNGPSVTGARTQNECLIQRLKEQKPERYKAVVAVMSELKKDSALCSHQISRTDFESNCNAADYELPYPWDGLKAFYKEVTINVACDVAISDEDIYKECVVLVKKVLGRPDHGFACINLRNSADYNKFVTFPKTPAEYKEVHGWASIYRQPGTIVLNPENDDSRDCTLIALNNALGRNIWPHDAVVHGPMTMKELQQKLRQKHLCAYGIKACTMLRLKPHKVEKHFNVISLIQGMHLLFTTVTMKDTDVTPCRIKSAKHTMLFDANSRLLNMGQILDENNEIIALDAIDYGVGMHKSLITFLRKHSNVTSLTIDCACEVMVNSRYITTIIGYPWMVENTDLPYADFPSKKAQLKRTRTVEGYERRSTRTRS